MVYHPPNDPTHAQTQYKVSLSVRMGWFEVKAEDCKCQGGQGGASEVEKPPKTSRSAQKIADGWS